MILGTDVLLESPDPIPFIYYAKLKQTYSFIAKIDNVLIHILYFKFNPFIYFLGEKDTPLMYL